MEPVLIEYASEKYPERLRYIENPPSRLYALGNIKILNELGIAVVGSRTNTQYGERMCKRFTKNLVEYNINIISGLAYGIDSIAHETCLKNSGKTIAVLPSGLTHLSIILLGFLSIEAFIVPLEFSKIPSAKHRYSL